MAREWDILRRLPPAGQQASTVKRIARQASNQTRYEFHHGAPFVMSQTAVVIAIPRQPAATTIFQ